MFVLLIMFDCGSVIAGKKFSYYCGRGCVVAILLCSCCHCQYRWQKNVYLVFTTRNKFFFPLPNNMHQKSSTSCTCQFFLGRSNLVPLYSWVREKFAYMLAIGQSSMQFSTQDYQNFRSQSSGFLFPCSNSKFLHLYLCDTGFTLD